MKKLPTRIRTDGFCGAKFAARYALNPGPADPDFIATEGKDEGGGVWSYAIYVKDDIQFTETPQYEAATGDAKVPPAPIDAKPVKRGMTKDDPVIAP